MVGVLSAMFGVTNRLISAAESAKSKDMNGVMRARKDLLELHQETVKDLVRSAERQDEVVGWIDECLGSNLDAVCRKIASASEATAEDMDRLSSTGERISNFMMAHFFRDAGLVDSECIQADELVVTDEVSGNATPDLAATRVRVHGRVVPLLDHGAIPLVTGFFGASPSGKVTTLGRGGSDLTAAVIGHALDADEVSLFKVEYTTTEDGWMDEWQGGWVGVVHDADVTQTIPELAYEEAAELAHYGKKVLHPACVFPAVEKQIPILVRNTFDTSHPGTRIAAAAPGRAPVQAVTKIALRDYEAKYGPVPVEQPLAGQPDSVATDQAAIVAMVGTGVTAKVDAEQVVGLLADKGVPAVVPRRVNGSPNNLSVIVPENLKHAAVVALHQQFVEAPASS